MRSFNPRCLAGAICAFAFVRACACGQVPISAGLTLGNRPDPTASGYTEFTPPAATPAAPAAVWQPTSPYSPGTNGPGLSDPAPGPSPAGGFAAACDECPKRGVVLFVSYDSWKGVPDGGWQNNGITSGLNFGTRLGAVSDWTGIGFQLGGSAAAYNWSGTDYRLTRQDEAQPQGFVTYGFFRQPTEESRWGAALVQDWMLNANYGVFAENPTLGQWRGQASYAFSAKNELGIWGTWRLHDDTRNIGGFGPTTWRAVNQLSVFWHHKWTPGGADTELWVGVPEHHRLGGAGSLGDYLVGLASNIPISDRFSIYSLTTYMHPSAGAGAAGFDEEAWNFTIGMSFYPAANARSASVAGQCWMPAMQVANNGYFLVDTNRAF